MTGITVREALELPALREAVLLAGASGLDRLITSVNIMEVPQIGRFVKRDELLLTTVYPLRDDPEAQAALIPTLVEKGLAALAIKPVPLWLIEIPPVMVAQAEELGFPLIRLPDSASFNEIINPILSEILNRQAALLLRSEEVHRTLTNIVLDGGSLAEIAQMLASLLEAPVSIHSTRLRLLAYCGAPSEKGGGSDRIGELAGRTKDLELAVRGRKGAVTATLDGQEVELVIHPVTVAHEDYAYLIVWRDQERLRRAELNAIEQAATVVALEIAKLRAVAEVERRFRSSLIEDLAQGKLKSRAEALARGEVYGWDLSLRFVPLLIEIDDFHRLYAGEKRGEAARILRRVGEIVSSTVALHAPQSIVADLGSRTLVLFHAPREGTGLSCATARTLAEQIKRGFNGERHIPAVSIGIGRPFDDILELRAGFEQANKALEVGRVVNGPGTVTDFDELGIYRILVECANPQELSRFAEDLLGRLIQSDRRGNGELLRTLEVVLQCNGNLRLAARELFVHYNTLRYRVARVAELTGVDLGSAEGRLSLQIALKILRITR
ncbi:MAG: PucR family transcriptional regulator [Betaproteobacteria bacterium]